MASDEGKRKTIPLRIGSRAAKCYQTVLVLTGACLMYFSLPFKWWNTILLAIMIAHVVIVWSNDGKKLDPALPILVITTFLFGLSYGLQF